MYVLSSFKFLPGGGEILVYFSLFYFIFPSILPSFHPVFFWLQLSILTFFLLLLCYPYPSIRRVGTLTRIASNLAGRGTCDVYIPGRDDALSCQRCRTAAATAAAATALPSSPTAGWASSLARQRRFGTARWSFPESPSVTKLTRTPQTPQRTMAIMPCAAHTLPPQSGPQPPDSLRHPPAPSPPCSIPSPFPPPPCILLSTFFRPSIKTRGG